MKRSTSKTDLKMNTVIQNILLLLAICIVNNSYAQEVKLPQEPMASIDIASLYTPATIIVAAQQMPEEFYSFRPTPELRSFGELLAHIAESNFQMGAIAKGEANPMSNVVPDKAEVIEALKKSFDYTAEARKNMTQERKGTMVEFMGGSQPAGNILDFSVFHSLQHYGNVIIYMRLKGLVPPSSQEGNPGNVPVKQSSKD